MRWPSSPNLRLDDRCNFRVASGIGPRIRRHLYRALDCRASLQDSAWGCRPRRAALARRRTTMSELPAIAIGGGLAGAAFALELARNGRPVIVLERASAPQHKVCGEFLSAEAQSLLQGCGLDLGLLHATTISHACLVSEPYQAIFQLPFVAAGLSRFQLDQALLYAAERAGAIVVRGTAVLGIGLDANAVLVKTDAK